MKRLVAYLIVLCILADIAAAQSGSIKLLAVSETPSGMDGSVADLSLDIKPGTGRVFIDTLPASKLDTQINTRFSRDMACKYLNVDCTKYDFFYTINADSSIIGGPSAGAATTLLTISLLGKIGLDKGTVVTGTINSGYLLGFVGGLKQKIDAAAAAGFKKVLIPTVEVSFTENNETINYVEYGNQRNITIVGVEGIDEALREFTGREFKKNSRQLEIDPSYKNTMMMLAEELCNRSRVISERVMAKKAEKEDLMNFSDERFTSHETKALNLTISGDEAFMDGKYYSAASYCFGANVDYHYLLFMLSNISEREMADMIEKTDNEVNSLNSFLNNYQIETITDLQAYSVSKERLVDATKNLNATIEAFKDGKFDDSYLSLAYAVERIYSASSWSRFLGKDGKEFDLKKDKLKESCSEKVNEAQTYYQYLQIIFPGLMSGVSDDIGAAEKEYDLGNYELCMHKASLAKAEVSIVLSTIGYKEENLQSLLDLKLNAAKKVIIEQQQNGIFPIVGYSYYEYAQSLRNESLFSALLYSEYALELSNFDMYFEPVKAKIEVSDTTGAKIFILGFITGGLVVALFLAIRSRPKKPKFRKPEHTRIKFDFSKKRKNYWLPS